MKRLVHDTDSVRTGIADVVATATLHGAAKPQRFWKRAFGAFTRTRIACPLAPTTSTGADMGSNAASKSPFKAFAALRLRANPGAALLALAFVVFSTPAHADNVTVGLFAPAAPFPSTAARLELANKLGEHIGKALGGTGRGRVYARAADFAAAVRKGDVTVALVDATYLASASNYTVLAASTRGGDTTQAWQVVAKSARKITELRGKRVLVPANGGREADLALNVLLGGVEKDFFKIEAAPDTVSAVAAVGLGKADAAIVPVGVELTGGTTQVLALPAIATPMLVAYGGVNAQQRAAIAAAVASFKGDATISGFRAGDADSVRAIARRFGAPVKRGPLVVPSVRLVVGDLVEGRKLSIERTPATQFAIVR